MSYEPMKDTYRVFLYVKAICPKCGFLMHTYGADFRRVTCGNGRDCEMAGIILEAPSMEVRRFIPHESGRGDGREGEPRPIAPRIAP